MLKPPLLWVVYLATVKDKYLDRNKLAALINVFSTISTYSYHSYEKMCSIIIIDRVIEEITA